MLDASDIRRLPMSHFTAPDGHALAGKQVVVTAFLVLHPRGPFLFDTGFGDIKDERIAHLKTVARSLPEALRKHGVALEDLRLLANCHLHFDHAGGNHRFRGVPIFCQKPEIEAVSRPDYTIASAVADFPDARFEVLEGEGEVLPGLRLISTPGHTDGHQSLVVETNQGRVVLAGQAFNSATDHAIATYARQLRLQGETHAPYPAWIDRFAELDPWRVLFAHDLAIWERGA